MLYSFTFNKELRWSQKVEINTHVNCVCKVCYQSDVSEHGGIGGPKSHFLTEKINIKNQAKFSELTLSKFWKQSMVYNN